VPIVPAILVGVLAIVLLYANVGNQSAFVTLTSVAIIMFYIPYLGVTAPMLIRRFRGTWPRPEHGNYFSLGRWGILVNMLAVAYGALMAFNVAFPRVAVYGNAHWYFRFGAYIFVGGAMIIGSIYYFAFHRRRPIEVIAEHRSDAVLAEPIIADVAP
jgi:amino acid transporter